MGADVRLCTERKMERDSVAKLCLTLTHTSSLTCSERNRILLTPQGEDEFTGMEKDRALYTYTLAHMGH